MSERPSDVELTRRLEAQLAQVGMQVAVDVADGALVLTGIVETEEARQAALDIATQAAPPNTRIDDQLEVESRLPTEIDDFVSDEPTAELPESAAEIEAEGGELEPDFTDQPGLFDPIAAGGPSDSAGPEDPVAEGEVYTPPTDPVLTTTPYGDARVLGGFGSEPGVQVERSAEDDAPGDEALADAIRQELAEDAATTDLNIYVAVRNGVAHLRGRVPDMDDADNVESVAARVPGVRDVVEELEVENV